jgi:cytochrome c-type biogenesis protein CcmH/NrfF
MIWFLGLAVGSVAAADEPAAAEASAEETFASGAALDGMPDGPAGPPPPPEEVQAIAHDIAVQLRCPVCQGLSAADSTSPAALAMQNRVRELVAAGYDEDQIKDFFVDRYGEWLLLEPKGTGLNRALWLLPWVGAGLGMGIAAWTLVGWSRRREDGVLPSDTTEDRPYDRYERVLLDELKDDE